MPVCFQDKSSHSWLKNCVDVYCSLESEFLYHYAKGEENTKETRKKDEEKTK